MEWIPTPGSSNVVGFGYDTETQILTVEFTRGATYNYYDVPEAIYEGMRAADSKGGYLARMVKGTYRYART